MPYRTGGWWYSAGPSRACLPASTAACPTTARARPTIDAGTAADPGSRCCSTRTCSPRATTTRARRRSQVSPDGDSLAYSVDHDGRRGHVLHVRDLPPARTSTRRSRHVLRLRVGGRQPHVLLHHARRDAAAVAGAPPRPRRRPADGPATRSCTRRTTSASSSASALSRSGRPGRHRRSASSITSEVHLIDAHDPTGPARLVAARRQGVEYSVAHHGDDLYVLANDERAELRAVAGADWPTPDPRQLAAGDPAPRRTPGSTASRPSPATSSSTSAAPGSPGLRVLDLADRRRAATSSFDEAVYTVVAGREPRSSTPPPTGSATSRSPRRRRCSRRTSPPASGGCSSSQPVLGDFDPADYDAARVWADGRRRHAGPDLAGVARAASPADGTAPGLLYGYGAYEIEHGPVVLGRPALAARPGRRVRHRPRPGRRRDGPALVRGRQVPGQAEHVLRLRRLRPATSSPTGWAAPDRLAARGGSAGGLLMGAATNLAPGRCSGRSSPRCPSSTPLNTILDPTLPAHRHRVGGVGQPDRRPRGVPLHAGLHARTRTSAARPTRRSSPPAASTTPGSATTSRPCGCSGCARPCRQTRRPRPSCSRWRWAPATAARPAATTPGARRPRSLAFVLDQLGIDAS